MWRIYQSFCNNIFVEYLLFLFAVSRCWMNSSQKAMLAHYCTNMTALVLLLFSGLVTLYMVYRQICTRDEWKQDCVAFFSIWGLSCLFGTSWCLTFLDVGFLSSPVLFLFCILNSFQGLYQQEKKKKMLLYHKCGYRYVTLRLFCVIRLCGC